MTNPTYIAPGNRTFDADSALSYDAEVVAGTGTIEAVAGHLLALISGTWTAYAVGTDATAQTGIKAAEYKVLYAGKVWEEFIRNAGIESSVTSFEALIAAPGKLVFANAEEVE